MLLFASKNGTSAPPNTSLNRHLSLSPAAHPPVSPLSSLFNNISHHLLYESPKSSHYFDSSRAPAPAAPSPISDSLLISPPPTPYHHNAASDDGPPEDPDAASTTTTTPSSNTSTLLHYALARSRRRFELGHLLRSFGEIGDRFPSSHYGMIAERSHVASREADINGTLAVTFFNDSEIWAYQDTNDTFVRILYPNGTFDDIDATTQYYNETVITILTAVVLALLILITVVGNVFVIAAILLERNLQSVANYLILSLAVADLLVAALVMPLGAVYEVSNEWTFGPELCDMWTVSDVLCCTASILHLVAIAIDRYWAVTNVDYIQQRSPRRVGSMIAIIWCVSTLISAAPLMGWKDDDWHGRLHVNKICLVSQDLYYQVFATMTSFYLPLGVILILYYRIYQEARKRIRRKVGAARTQAALCKGTVAISETTTFTRVSSANGSPEKSSNGALADSAEDRGNEEVLRFKMAALPLNPLALLGTRAPRRREMDARRERKAAKTLAVITGAFVICWLPFFVTALLMPLCTESCYFSPYLVSVLLWLGYFNSTLNPIIYTIFSPDFRHAFRRILCGKKRLRKRQYESRVSSGTKPNKSSL